MPNGSFCLISSGLSKALSPAAALSFHSENADPLRSSFASCRESSRVSLRAEIWGFVEAANLELWAARTAYRFNDELSGSEKSKVADVVVDISGVVWYPTHCLCRLSV